MPVADFEIRIRSSSKGQIISSQCPLWPKREEEGCASIRFRFGPDASAVAVDNPGHGRQAASRNGKPAKRRGGPASVHSESVAPTRTASSKKRPKT